MSQDTDVRTPTRVAAPTETPTTPDHVNPDARRRSHVQENFERARLATSMGKWRTALVLLADCLRAEPDHPEFQSLFGYCLARDGVELPKALALCKAAVQARSYDPILRTHLGWVYLAQADRVRARACFETALRMEPDLDLAQDGHRESQRQPRRLSLQALLRVLRLSRSRPARG